ncbi:hypothetical protein MITS9504_00602 [Synechococcus sp. MIT S9504]|nr:hypothetical protein MITS9504_00602 [Synechococcus sp. MIT S9504]
MTSSEELRQFSDHEASIPMSLMSDGLFVITSAICKHIRITFKAYDLPEYWLCLRWLGNNENN